MSRLTRSARHLAVLVGAHLIESEDRPHRLRRDRLRRAIAEEGRHAGSSTGERSTSMPGSAIRKCSPSEFRERGEAPAGGQQARRCRHGDDDRVQARVGEEGGIGLL